MKSYKNVVHVFYIRDKRNVERYSIKDCEVNSFYNFKGVYLKDGCPKTISFFGMFTKTGVISDGKKFQIIDCTPVSFNDLTIGEIAKKDFELLLQRKKFIPKIEITVSNVEDVMEFIPLKLKNIFLYSKFLLSSYFHEEFLFRVPLYNNDIRQISTIEKNVVLLTLKHSKQPIILIIK